MDLREKNLLREQVDLMDRLSGFDRVYLGIGNFNHYAKAPTSLAVENTKKLVRILSSYDFLPEKLVPSGNGGVTLFYYNGSDIPCMFDIQNEGKIWAANLKPNNPFLELVNLDNFDEGIIKEFKNRLR